ncbi:hypothetical protein D3C81_993490 [compost metagenome]
MSLLAIASAMLRGKTWLKNDCRVKPVVVGREELLICCAVGNAKSKAAPGWKKLANPIPIASDTNEAVINQVIDLSVILPIDVDFPIDTMPATIVANTSGAIIILIKRKKMSEIMLK